MDKEIISLLNETTYSEEEIAEFMQFAKIDDYKLNKITNDVKTKIAKDSFKKSLYFVSSILNEDEEIEKIIKGTDIDATEEYTSMSVMVNAPFMSSDGFAINKIIFITNKRIIIVDSNYYNKGLDYKVYDLSEIKSITCGKKIKRKYRVKGFFKRNNSFLKVLFALFILFQALFAGLILLYFTLEFISKFITNHNIVVVIARLLSLGLIYLIIAKPKFEREAIIEVKNGMKYDIIIRNGDYKEIQDYLKNLNEENFYELIKSLKEKDKIIFVRRYLLDEQIEKISLDLELTKEAVYKRLSRGKEIIKLREVD